SALTAIQTSLGSASYVANSSDPGAVSVTAATGALEGTYSVDVSDVGSYTNTASNTTLPAVSDPTATSISTSTDYTLTVDGNTFDIKPGGGSLMALAQAINGSSADVQASLVNVGNTSAPQYRLLVRSTNLGPVAIQLNDGTQDLLGTLNTGT